MAQRLNIWHHQSGDRQWLAMLVDAMEEASRAEVRALPCEASVLQALRAQLAQPVTGYRYPRTPFSLRN